nr:hypothetical protein Iba_chr08cCG13920 [Ipomoea batatas]
MVHISEKCCRVCNNPKKRLTIFTGINTNNSIHHLKMVHTIIYNSEV